MVSGDWFSGDIDKELQRIQHELYDKLIVCLFSEARAAFLHAERMLNQQTTLGRIVRDRDSFDHRVLQRAHDMIAAEFRYERSDLLQLDLPFEKRDCGSNLEQEWTGYFRQEAEKLSQQPEICRAILTAVAFQNTPLGNDADDALGILLMGRDSLFLSGTAKGYEEA